MQETFRFEIGEAEAKQRLDKFIFAKIGFLSRMYLNARVASGFCTVNGEVKLGGYKLKINDLIEISVDLSAATSMSPENIPLEILFEDEELLVIVKPAGMLVHPSRYVRGGTLLNALAFHLNRQIYESGDETGIQKASLIRAGLPHRLDRETSGLMLISKTERAQRILSAHFQRKLIAKTYLALVEGIMAEDSGTIHAPIGRIDGEIPHWRIAPEGKPAETRFEVLERREDVSLLKLEPITGRTNQLRIHCAHRGHPILGDVWRGGREFSRLCLHAAKIGFFHPNGGWLEFESTLPPEMQ